MVKKNAKSRARKIDVSDAVKNLERKNEQRAAQEKLATGKLFVLDTVGSTKNLPRKIRRKTDLEKKQKNLSKLSNYELAKIEKTRKREENRLKHEKKASVQKSNDKTANIPAHKGKQLELHHKKAGEKHAFDLWATTLEQDADKKKTDSELLIKDKNLKPLLTNNNLKFRKVNSEAVLRPKSKPQTLGQKTSLAPATVLPDHGLSMNPGEEIFETKLDEIVAEEHLKNEEEQMKDLRAKKPMTMRLLDAYTKEELLQMSDLEKLKEYKRLMKEDHKLDMDTVLEEENEDEEAAATGANKGTKKTPSNSDKKKLQRDERKTKTQRNKEERVKNMDLELTAKKRQKLLEKSIGQIPNMMREMVKDDKAKEEQKAFIEDAKQENVKLEEKGIVLKPKKIGRNRFVEQSVVPEKSVSSLRSTQVTSAVSERMQSFHRRNMGELPPESNRAALLRVRKKANRKQKANKFVQRSLMLG
ncbi:unnamed protein product [Amoebophrya sp. A120]|nr:unnamed protein product [Amoebophrya sp. A120]|eukprot:GSA120T00020115001.1